MAKEKQMFTEGHVAPGVPAAAHMRELLSTPAFAAGYLQDVLEQNDMALLLRTIRQLCDAHGGVAGVAQRAGISRTYLYKMLSGEGVENPSLLKLSAVLRAMGFKLAIVES